jgi:hypothetical protein
MLLEVRHLRALEASPSHRDRDGTGVFDQPLDGLGPVLLDRPSRWALRRRHRWGISPKRLLRLGGTVIAAFVLLFLLSFLHQDR